MRKICLSIMLISITTLLFGQHKHQLNYNFNNIYYEFCGNGLFTSINYERQFGNEPGFGAHAGLGYYPSRPSVLTIPVGINYLFDIGNEKEFIDLGFGVTYAKTDVKLYTIVDIRDPNYVNKNHFYYIPSLGYRFHTNKNFMWRFSFSLVKTNYDLLPFIGIAFGKMF